MAGGAGYIGSHCAKLLTRRGYPVVVYDNLSRGYREALLYGQFFQGDVGSRADLTRLFDAHPIDAVMHFAGFINVGESVHKPDLYLENNAEKTRTFLEFLAERKVPNVIFSSTCAVYGNPQKLPLIEDHPRAPINPYGESKYRTELALEELHSKGLLNFIAFRYFNAAGADPDAELGERHDPETHLIPLAIRAALGTAPALQLFGNDYPTPDGTCVRDYIHINDICNAHLLGLEYLLSGGESGFFNLGNGHGFTVLEVLKSVERAVGRPVPFVVRPRRDGDAVTLIGDAGKARTQLGWKTEFPDLDDIVRSAVAFEKRLTPPPGP